MLKEKSDVDDNNVSPALLKRSSILSWEEKQLIDFVRNNPQTKDELLLKLRREILKKIDEPTMIL